MLFIGEKVKYLNHIAVVLIANENEALLYIDVGYVKWVDLAMIELQKTA